MRINNVSNPILVIIGLVVMGIGIYFTVAHYLVMRKPYTLVKGRITAYEKEIHYSRHSRKTVYYPVLQFEYKGHTYAVRDPNGLSDDEKDGYEKYVGDTVEIRVPEDDPYSAMLNYEASLYRRYKDGAVYIGIGLFIVVLAVMLLVA